ncbi:ABC-F type ribosomal protection protein [Virgibacillus pantothenticus]|uniref:ABC transporter n=1 Tax=Virgibacillus pantothenticus TaxID=1473 RepID=A0A0L0QKD6_VIRPA|nr:ABC-F type ribosomal protection protein [Virgibacillus pantothenticus]KNE18989.1 ABC transporter [Virgibacillus pantothenticus]MBU8565292.1 ABC-F type ribosomal protection protein [Virgibacillus pantothenticus]MBU8599489.1 ABC-F type ribosomal protection protein [Virgibacillus pantothenticus]MBU8633611.1 ABC-F type ribosomal protection protein [Virgibacillus pantothenticus]MBU8641769.1 ABC-F type ribosomal protection protein [Virgibacillus pantothenticus]
MGLLLEASNITHFIRDRKLIATEALRIHKGDRIGLVGKNGSGKTTLLHILAQKITAETGKITLYGTIELVPQLKQMNTTKSGGEVTQAYINNALASNADILLADEPTTNLDTFHIEKVEKQLQRWKGALILVSHDREFLDSLCTSIWELENGSITEYKGNYSDYQEQKDLKLYQQEQAYENYVKKKTQLEEALELKEKKAQRATKKPKQTSNSEAKITGAKPYFANKQKKLRKAAKAIETRLEKLEKVEKVKEMTPIKMNLPNEDAINGRSLIRVEDLEGQIDQRLLWNKVSFQIKGGDKIAVIGANGSGKTTFIKKLLHQTKQIHHSPAIKIGYFSQNLDVLDTSKSILQNVSDTSNQTETLIRTVLARLHFYRDDVYKQVAVLSGGERVKVAFAKLFVSDINTLILDEPTNFLDIEAVEALEELLVDYEGTVLFVSHDRRLIRTVATRIMAFEDQTIKMFTGNYEDYKQGTNVSNQDSTEQELMVIETKITEVLGKLSLEHSDQLEQEFQALIARKGELQRTKA